MKVNIVYCPIGKCSALLFLVLLTYTVYSDPSLFDNDKLDQHFWGNVFAEYLQKYNKWYEPDSEEYYHRLRVFKENVLYVQNKLSVPNDMLSSSSVYGLTKFMDMTPEEFEKKYLSRLQIPNKSQVTYNASLYDKSHFTLTVGDVKAIDWRTKAVVTGVKNQLKCGACWAFVLAEEVESMAAIAHNSLVEYSPQEVLDCSDYSCDGGNFCDTTDKFHRRSTPIVKEEDSPYTGKKNLYCDDTRTPMSAFIKDYQCYELVKNEVGIANLLASVGPVGVAVDARTWQFYSGGIIQYHCESNLNHAAQIVGYDTTGDVPYYIVRNSWGADWGDGGYIYLAMGKNICGLAQMVISLHAQRW